MIKTSPALLLAKNALKASGLALLLLSSSLHAEVTRKKDRVQFLVLGEKHSGKSVLSSLLRDLGQNIFRSEVNWRNFIGERYIVSHAQYRYDIARYHNEILKQRIEPKSKDTLDTYMGRPIKLRII